MKRLLAVKFVVQPVLVSFDGETVAEVQTHPITVHAAELNEFPAQWATELEAAEKRLNE